MKLDPEQRDEVARIVQDELRKAIDVNSLPFKGGLPGTEWTDAGDDV